MARRRKVAKRIISPDYKYKNEKVAKLINYLMKGGKKSISTKIVYTAFDLINSKTEHDSIEVFEEAINNIKPLLQVKAKRVGGATYQIPVEVKEDKALSFSLKWMVEAVRARALKDSVKDLAQVIIDSSNKTGYAISKRNDMHRQADANKAFAHFRW